jgi:hypothetical protein
LVFLQWYKCMGEVWCDLNRVDADHQNIAGISGAYIIWHGSDADHTVIKVGYGVVSKELKSNKDDIAVQAFAKYGLKVSWAEVPKSKLKGCAKYLTTSLKPKITEDIPKAKPFEVTSPWDVFEED